MGRNRGGPLTRWTADTEVAFLLGLRLTGSVTAACREIGRSTHGADSRRKRLPEFAAKWKAVLDEKYWEKIAAERARRLRTGDVSPDGEEGEMPNRPRYDGFTPLRQRAYLRALSETGGYEQACRKVGVSSVAARNMRRKFPSFAAACERAIARSGATLEQIAFERATQGWDEPIVHAGQVVGQRRRYSDALLRLLLQREADRDLARAAAERTEEAKPKRMSGEEVNALLARKLDALAASEDREERERRLEWADEMVRRGLAP